MRTVRSLVAIALASGSLLVTAAPADAIASPVDIRVEHDLVPTEDGPRVLEALGVTPGAGPEITIADEVDNPSAWGGNVLVDIDPDADTITVEVEESNCYDTILVEIVTDEVGAVTVLSDDIFDPDSEEGPVTLSTSVSGGVITLSWVSDGIDCPALDDAGATSVFSYELAGSDEPEASLSPASVQAGSSATVSGVGCPSGPVFATIAPEGGGAPIADDVEQTVADAEGDWTFDIDTAGLAPGTYVVETRCVQADLAGFDYDVLSFVVTAPMPTPTPTPRAVPVAAAPSFTG